MKEDIHVSSFWDHSFNLPMKGTECYKPVIVAVNGHCLAGGLELALMGDIRIASENATFGQPEINWGIMPGMGATQRLPRILPYNMACEILFTGDPIDAEHALRIGLINRVVPLPELMHAARALAKILCEKPPLALRAIKEALLRSYDLPLEQGLRFESCLRRIVGETKDAREGMTTFTKGSRSRSQTP
jgi:enoyl-CoA hydratase/carnithine racemase